VIDAPGRVGPDPAILERPFLAVPRLELAPGVRLPGTGLPLAEHPVGGRTTGMTQLPDLTRRLKEMVDR
jgi:hypothetical protein